MNVTKRFERLLLICGILLLIVFAAFRVYSSFAAELELKRFQDLQAEQQTTQSYARLVKPSFHLDFSLWSKERIAAYQHTLGQQFAPALAVLRIAKVHLEVPVLEGTDDLTLDRGVGHISGTVSPGESGNIGIAGHRDGFFRALKDVKQGDTIDLVGFGRTDHYVVDQILLVRPDDISVLQPGSNSSLTLVTCYPFYYVGSAPQRYIVQASLTGSSPIPPTIDPESAPSEKTALAQGMR